MYLEWKDDYSIKKYLQSLIATVVALMVLATFTFECVAG